jgi:6-phosphogluconolactonase
LASKGIYRLELDLGSGRLSAPVLAGEAVNPSFVAIHPNRHFLYAVNEASDFKATGRGAVAAFAIDPQTGKLTLLNQQSSGGPGPCHLVTDRQGKHVLAANYGGGSVCVLPIQADGRLGPATAFVQHHGSSINKKRQEAPHAHSINLDAANRFAIVADLGIDKVLVYRYDAPKGTLTPNDPPAATVAPGAGPRHFALHPDGKHAYVINEMACTVTAFDYDADKGTLQEIQTITTLPGKIQESYSTAEVQVHPSGKFLYGSNRGQNTIAIFRIDPKTGKLTPAGHQGQQIKTPRNFGIDPTGAYLLAANQDADTIVVFRIDGQTGALTPTGNVVEVAKPVCVRFLAPG